MKRRVCRCSLHTHVCEKCWRIDFQSLSESLLVKKEVCRRSRHTLLQKVALAKRRGGKRRGGKRKRRKENKQGEATRREKKRRDRRRGEKIGDGNEAGLVHINFVLLRSLTRYQSSLDIVWEVCFIRPHCHDQPGHAFRNTFCVRHVLPGTLCSGLGNYQ